MIEFLSSPRFLMGIGALLSIYLYEYMHRTFYPHKEWVKDKKWLYILVYFLTAVSWHLANELEIPIVNLFSMIASFLIPLFIFFEVKNIRGIVYYSYYVVGTVICEVIIGVGSGTLRNGMKMETSYEVMTPIYSVIMNLSEILITLSLCHFGSKEKNNHYDKISRSFMVLPVVSVAIIITNYLMVAFDMISNFNQMQFVQLGVVLLFINVILFIVMEKYTESLKQEEVLNEAKAQMESDVRIMELASKSMRDKLAASEQTLQADRLMRHDRRHFESLLLTLLKEGKADEAVTYLEERLKAEPKSIKKFCENTTVNAAIGYYFNMAEKEGIVTDIRTNIPSELKVDDMELAIVISNLYENAIHACEKLPSENREIRIAAKYKNQLLLTIENPYEGEINLDSAGYPVTNESDHGIGTKSIQAFVNNTDSEISYSIKDNRFIVRMIINA